jgi:hypothetical protein
MKQDKKLALRGFTIVLTLGGILWLAFYKILFDGLTGVPSYTARMLLIAFGGGIVSLAVLGTQVGVSLDPTNRFSASFVESHKILGHKSIGIGIGWLLAGSVSLPIIPSVLVRSVIAVSGLVLVAWCHIKITQAIKEKCSEMHK